MPIYNKIEMVTDNSISYLKNLLYSSVFHDVVSCVDVSVISSVGFSVSSVGVLIGVVSSVSFYLLCRCGLERWSALVSILVVKLMVEV